MHVSADAFRNRKVLVTGGAGFVGRHLVKRLRESGASVVVVDDLSSSTERGIGPLTHLFIGDFGDLDRDVVMRDFVKSTEVCFHLACRNIIQSVKLPEQDLMVNGLSALRLMRMLPVDASVVYTSSASVYGDGALPFRESDLPRCKTPYSVSKLAGEGYVHLYHPTAVILRLSNVYGPGQHVDVGVANRFMAAAMARKPLTIIGNGHQTRDYTYVDDVVDALLLAGEKQTGKIYNVGTGIATSSLRLARLVLECVQGTIWDLEKCIETIPDRPMLESIQNRSVDATMAATELGWSAATSLEQGLSQWRATGIAPDRIA